MDFTAFDTKKMDEYAARAKEAWGNTEAYKEFEEKTKNKTDEQMKDCRGSDEAICSVWRNEESGTGR